MCPGNRIAAIALGRKTAARAPFPVRFWWVTLVRGLLIFTLGLLLVFGENTRGNVATFFAMYWILTGGLAIRWALSPSRDRIPLLVLVAGMCGLATGAVVLARYIFASILSTEATIYLVGGTVLLVGVLQIARSYRTEHLLARRWGWDHMLLGLLEGVLGASLITNGVDGAITNAAITLWSVGGGTILILDALQLRQAGREYAARGLHGLV
jgi:uncharacterized membrane protein HdeD (DUF308 family)